MSFHTFRHTCASLLFEEGRNVKQVSAYLGHADPGFTLRTYIHLLDTGVGGGLELAPVEAEHKQRHPRGSARVNTGSTQGAETAATPAGANA